MPSVVNTSHARSRKLRSISSGLLALALTTAQAALPPLLAEQEEIAAALEGAPPHLQKDAGVMVLKATGYVSVRDSRNGFTCLLFREWGKSFEPTCYDAEGVASLLPVALFRAESVAKGVKPDVIQAEVADGFFTGRFRAPKHSGIAYMLSKRNIVVLDREKQVVGPAAPHLMFYSPYATSAAMGARPDLASHFVIADEGSPHALIIVPVGQSAAHAHQ